MADPIVLPLIDGPAVGKWINDAGADADELTLIAGVAVAHIERLVMGRGAIPLEVAKLAALDVASDLWDHRTAPNGVRMFADGLDGFAAPVRVRSDATTRARAILAPWLPPTVD